MNKSNSTSKTSLHAVPATLKSSNGGTVSEGGFPIAYADNIWDVVFSIVNNEQTKLSELLGEGQFDQHTINEELAKKISECVTTAAMDYYMGKMPQNISDLNDDRGLVESSELADVATSGDYGDLNNTPFIPENISDLNDDRDLVSRGDLATVATTGSYNDLSDTPDLSDYATQADVDYLQSEIDQCVKSENLADVATSGSYNDLEDKPDLATVATTGSYNDLSDTPDLSDYATQADVDYLQSEIDQCVKSENLADVATSGSYNDLEDKPSIPQNISDLNDDSDFVESSELATVATSGSYNDLEDKPSIPQNISDLYDDRALVESNDLAAVATSGDYGDLENTPNLAAVATTGSYDDLSDKPDLSGYASQADVDYITADLAQLPHFYTEAITDGSTTGTNGRTTATIYASSHQCGQHPIVQATYGGKVVAVDIEIVDGDITIGWNNLNVNSNNPLHISVVGVDF